MNELDLKWINMGLINEKREQTRSACEEEGERESKQNI